MKKILRIKIILDNQIKIYRLTKFALSVNMSESKVKVRPEIRGRITVLIKSIRE